MATTVDVTTVGLGVSGDDVASLLDRLRRHYLPELQSLLNECNLVKWKTGLNNKPNPNANEERMLKFAAGLEGIIQRIQTFVPTVGSVEQARFLMNMEAKISNAILPVKQKMVTRFEEAMRSCVANGGRLYSKASAVVEGAGGAQTRKATAGELARQAITEKRKQEATQNIAQNRSKKIQRTNKREFIDSESGNSTDNMSTDYNSSESSGTAGSGPHEIAPVASVANTHFDPAGLSDGVRWKAPQLLYSHQPPAFGGRKNVTDFMNEPLEHLLSDTYHSHMRMTEGESGVTSELKPDGVYVSTSQQHPSIAMCSDGMRGVADYARLPNPVEYDDEYTSSKRRRKLNHIVPFPRKPRLAHYNCSVCNEPYRKIVHDNPWWAVYVHECPKCRQNQVPRIDITAPNNAIELDPNVMALYGEGIGESGDEEDFEGEESGDEGEGGEEQAEKVFDGEGLLDQDQAAKLLVLMAHARTCTGHHSSEQHAEVCKSTKYLMLHIRDCKGVNADGGLCGYPWCSPCKRMLHHLTHCFEPSKCTVCNPWSLSDSYRQLRSINDRRLSMGSPRCLPAISAKV